MDIRNFFGGQARAKKASPAAKQSSRTANAVKEVDPAAFFASGGALPTSAAPAPAIASKSKYFAPSPQRNAAVDAPPARKAKGSPAKRSRPIVIDSDEDGDADDVQYVAPPVAAGSRKRAPAAGAAATPAPAPAPAAKKRRTPAGEGKAPAKKKESATPPKAAAAAAAAAAGRGEPAAKRARGGGGGGGGGRPHWGGKNKNVGPAAGAAAPPRALPAGPADCFAKMSFVITGLLPTLSRDEAKAFVERHGGRVTTAVSGKTAYLVVGTKLEDGRPIEEGSKYRKATEKGTPKVDEDGLVALVLARLPPAQRAAFEKAAERADATREAEQAQANEAARARVEEVLAASGAARRHVDESTMLWTDKHRPRAPGELVGNAQALRQLTNWLQNWEKWHLRREEKPPYARGNPGAKAVLLSGPPGIGKTSAATLVAASMGYEVMELNASDTRSKRTLKEQVAEVVTMRVLDFGGASGAPRRRRVVVMDEVDGISGNSDRGGVQELVEIIRRSKTPIVCIANDREHQKMRTLANHCFDVRFVRPTAQEIAQRAQMVVAREGMRAEPAALERIAEETGGDMRQVLNVLQMWKQRSDSVSVGDVAGRMGAIEKDRVLRVSTSEAAAMQFRRADAGAFADRFNAFFVDYDMVPLLVQQQYLRVWDGRARELRQLLARQTPPAGRAAAQRLQDVDIAARVALSAEAVSDADAAAFYVRARQRWDLLTTYAALNVRVGRKSAGQPSLVPFPEWLGKNSTASKSRRLLSEIATHTRAATRCGSLGVRLDYMSSLRAHLLRPLMADKPEPRRTVDELEAYGLRREDFVEGMHQFVFRQGGRAKAAAAGALFGESTYEQLGKQSKMAFTRAYNASAHRAQTTAYTGDEKQSDFAKKAGGAGKKRAAKKKKAATG